MDSRDSPLISDKQVGFTSSEMGSDNLSAITRPSDECPEPTNEELQTLRKIAGSISWVSYALCVVEFAERASYYGKL